MQVIPYTGYTILDFMIGGLRVRDKGVVIVKNQGLGPKKNNFWNECD